MVSRTSPTSASRAPTPRRELDTPAIGLMLIFCVAIGLQQVAIKSVADTIAPLAQIGLRSTGAAILVALVARFRGIRLLDAAYFRPGFLIGLGFTGEFAFVALGLNYTLASHMAVFLYTAPVFAALGLHWFVPGEQMAPRHWGAVALAFTGLVVAIAPNTQVGDVSEIVIGDALGVLAGLSWAATTIVFRRSSLSDAPPVQSLFYQLTTAALLLVPTAWLLGDLAAIEPNALMAASLGFQTLIVSFAAFLLWFALLRHYLASRLGVFSFLSPIFGVIFGAVLLNEPLSLNFLIGGLAILAAVVWISR